MLNRTNSVWAISALLWLTSCQTQTPVPEEPAQETPSPVAAPIPPPEDDLTPSARVRRALQALQIGDQDSARRQLVWALQSKPSYQIAGDLLDQLDADPQEYLGEESFVYQVQPGDSLGKISKAFLNDPLKFVILARYNEIENPSLLRVGQSIRIPGRLRPPEPESAEPTTASPSQPAPAPAGTLTTEAPVGKPGTAPSAPSREDVAPSIRSLYEAGDYREVIMIIEGHDSAHQSNESRKLLLNAYIAYANELIAKNDLSAARFTLEKALALAPDNEAIGSALTIVKGKLEGQRLFAEGRFLVEHGRLEEAHRSFSQALVNDPEHPSARQELEQTRQKLVDGYHREAMELFRRQRLDEAISYWDKALELEPTHDSALAYRARALEMKKRLRQIDKK